MNVSTVGQEIQFGDVVDTVNKWQSWSSTTL